MRDSSWETAQQWEFQEYLLTLESPAFKTTVSPRIKKKTQLFSCSKLHVYTFGVILLRPEQQATFRGPVVIAEGVLMGAPQKKMTGLFQNLLPLQKESQ